MFDPYYGPYMGGISTWDGSPVSLGSGDRHATVDGLTPDDQKGEVNQQ